MKKNIGFIIFITVCVLLCLVPSVCMIFDRTDEPIGNESLVEAPRLKEEDGSINVSILSDFGNYFEAHYAFRPALISLDAKIQEQVFLVSNTETVVTGTDGWLYYSSTVNDYLGRNQLSDRGMFNLAHNVSLLQDYVTGQGARFLFTIAPNKNTLYGEHMPYYEQEKAGTIFNRDRLKESLEEEGVHYADIFSLFENCGEVLYLKQDSHWNNKGACLVYNELMDALEKDHRTYENVPVTCSRSHSGDLSAMLYPGTKELEMDYTYEYEPSFEYIPSPLNSDPVSVEDFRIETKNENAEDHLLMYRDSFGNTLIPFIANEFQSCFFTKAKPYILALHMKQYNPNVVILEKVERNLRDFAEDPGVIPSPKAKENPANLYFASEGDCRVQGCQADTSFIEISGVVSESDVSEKGRIFLQVQTPLGEKELYEAFTVSNHDSDYGYIVYLPLEKYGTIESLDKQTVRVFTEK